MNAQLKERPLIGIPTWSDSSQYYSGVPLYGMNQSYVATLTKAGALPILIPLHMDEESLQGMLQRIDGLFLAGGGDIAPRIYDRKNRDLPNSMDIERDMTELILTHWALELNMPVLGVCRGMQLINIACGGTLYQDLSTQRPDLDKHDYISPDFKRDDIRHDVDIPTDSYLGRIFGPTLGVNSMHHQGVNEVGKNLRVIATSTDGLAEAIESTRNQFVLGFQWHPEELIKTDSRNAQIFQDFLGAAQSNWRNRPLKMM